MAFTSNDINVLEKMAGVSQVDDLSEFEHQLPTGEVGEALAKILELEKTNRVEEAARVIAEVLRVKSTKVNDLVSKIRDLRRQERDLLNILKLYKQAEEYGANTNNYAPLAKVLNDPFPNATIPLVYGLTPAKPTEEKAGPAPRRVKKPQE